MNSFLKTILLLIAYSMLQSCATQRYSMSEIDSNDYWGGTVYALYSGSSLCGTIFDESRMTFPGPQFKVKFTPTLNDIRLADSIRLANMPYIVNTAKRYKVNYHLRKRDGLRKYFRQYVGGLSDNGERLIWVNLYYRERQLLEKLNITEIISVCDGGDSKWEVYINLDQKTLYNLSINGLG